MAEAGTGVLLHQQRKLQLCAAIAEICYYYVLLHALIRNAVILVCPER